MFGVWIYEPHQASRLLSTGAAICGLIAGVMPAVGSRHPRAQRWLLLVSLATLSVTFGVLSRMILRGLYSGRG
jgi:hypothetical protein